MRSAVLVSISSLLALTGCSTLDGPPPVLRATGPVSPSASVANKGLIGRFAASAGAAAAPGASPTAATAMLEDGFTLVYAHCNDFFLHAGREQSRLLVLKDATAAAGTLAAGIIALSTGGTGGKTALGIVTLGTSATLSGIDIYTQQYLFGAENVDAVRELTLNALSAHGTTVRTTSPATYNAVVAHLFDNQAICTPRRIAMLAREAIQNGKVVASPISPGSMNGRNAAADDAVLDEVGRVLGLSGKADANTTGAIFWLLERRSTAAERAGMIRPLLANVPDASNPFDPAGKLRDPIPGESGLTTALAKLSADAVRALDEQIAESRRSASVAGAGAPLPPPTFTLPQAIQANGRVNVSVQ